MLNEDEAFWREIIKLFSQEDNFVLLIGKPSIRKMHEREAAEEKLITDRKIALGDEGLAEKAQFLKDAKAANDAKKIPNAVLAKIPIPSVDSIILSEVITLGSRRLHPEGTQTNKEKNYAHITRHINVLDSPLALQISHYESPFVQLGVFAHAGGLEPELKQLLKLYVDLIFKTSVQRGSHMVSHEEVEMEMSRETENYYAAVSMRSGIVHIQVSVEKEKLLQGLQYLKEGLTQQIHTLEQLWHYMTTFLQAFPSKMKSAEILMEIYMKSMLFKNEQWTLIAQRDTLVAIEKDIKENGAKETIMKLKKITEYLTNPERLIFHIAGDISAIGEKLKKEERKDLEQVG